MNLNNSRAYKTRSALSLSAVAAGLLLMTYMIIIEDEPGAIPLLLITLGTLSYVYNRVKYKTRQG